MEKSLDKTDLEITPLKDPASNLPRREFPARSHPRYRSADRLAKLFLGIGPIE